MVYMQIAKTSCFDKMERSMDAEYHVEIFVYHCWHRKICRKDDLKDDG